MAYIYGWTWSGVKRPNDAYHCAQHLSGLIQPVTANRSNDYGAKN